MLLGLAGSLAYLVPSGEYDSVIVGGVVKEKRVVHGFPFYPWYERIERSTLDGSEVTSTFRWYTSFPALATGIGCLGTILWRGYRPGNWVKRDDPDPPG